MDIDVTGGTLHLSPGVDTAEMFRCDLLVAPDTLNPGDPGLTPQMTGKIGYFHMAAAAGIDSVDR
jgi:hypothetical protein